jgi:hypothetical protein
LSAREVEELIDRDRFSRYTPRNVVKNPQMSEIVFTPPSVLRPRNKIREAKIVAVEKKT